jgi:hypothetical protein
MRWLPIAITVLLLAASTAGRSADQSLDALKARAESARPNEKGRMFAMVARREVNEADRFYTDGDIGNAKKAVDEVVLYAGRAAEAAGKSGKHLKDTEILLRQTARRLDEVRKTLNFEDRPDVEAAVKQVENIRQKLLNQMFGLPSRESKK